LGLKLQPERSSGGFSGRAAGGTAGAGMKNPPDRRLRPKLATPHAVALIMRGHDNLRKERRSSHTVSTGHNALTLRVSPARSAAHGCFVGREFLFRRFRKFEENFQVTREQIQCVLDFAAKSTQALLVLRTNNWDFVRAAISRRMRAVPVFTPPALSVSGKDVFNGATHQRLCATNPLGLIATEFFVDYLSAALYQYI
jgi:hypothetical protein